MKQSHQVSSARTETRWPALIMLMAYAAAIGGLWILRYATLWMEIDTSSMTRFIEIVRAGGVLNPAGQPGSLPIAFSSSGQMVYPHGIGYQAVSTMIVSISGTNPQTLQSILYPILSAVWLALVAFVFYTQLTLDHRVAVLAVLFLFLQPDVLFVTLRGSHEKLDWPLMMMVLTFLCFSFRSSQPTIILHVLLFYLGVFAMIAINTFFASTFLLAVFLSLLLGLVVSTLQRHPVVAVPHLRRLVYVAVTCSLLIFLFLAYIYPIGLANLRTLRSVLDQTSVLLLGFEAQGQPYASISSSWISPRVYFSLTLFTWLLVFLSFAEWLRRGKQILKKRKRLDIRQNLDWLLYAGFALQVAVAIVVDFSGALGQNLQLRMFPAFTVIAVVLLANGAVQMVSSRRFYGWTRRITLGAAALAVAWFGIASILKATNEPVLSNKWTYYTRSEESALRWVDSHLQSSRIWTGIDERLRETFRFRYASTSDSHNLYDAYDYKPEDRHILMSERERFRAVRMGIAMPAVLAWNRVYDNGDVYLYSQRPRTPFQR